MLDKLKEVFEAQKKMNQMKKELDAVVIDNETAGGKADPR